MIVNIGVYLRTYMRQYIWRNIVEHRTHELVDFMRRMTAEMAEDYSQIQKRATEDPGTAGDQGEENWATLFRDWLPPTYHVVTKGRILGHTGEASRQVDVLVLHPTYPRRMLGQKLYLSAGVAAAFECKVTLKAAHIRDAMENAALIRRLLPPLTGTPYRELNSSLIYGLLAHSHSWKGPKSTPVHNIRTALQEADTTFAEHPRELLDMLCVADLGIWKASKTVRLSNEGQCLHTTYIGPSYEDEDDDSDRQPIGPLLSALWTALAWREPANRDLARYFTTAGLGHGGIGFARFWPLHILTDAVKLRIQNEQVPFMGEWNEWLTLWDKDPS
jgi:hypothetical protein